MQREFIRTTFSVLHAKRDKFLKTNIHRVLKRLCVNLALADTKEFETVPLGSLNLLLTKLIRDVFTI